MAINRETVARTAAGLPTAEAILAGTDTDNLTASIVDPDTNQEAPAALQQGEYVIDVPSLIGLGDGDYEMGLERIQEIHQLLREKGLALIEQQGISGV